MSRSIRLLTGLVAGLGVVGWAHAQVTNGTFETPPQPAPPFGFSAYSIVVPDTVLLPGWTVVPGAGVNAFDQNVNLIRSDGSSKQGAVTTTQWIDLTGGRDTITGGVFGNGLTQTLNLTPGQPYQLSYYAGSLFAGPYTHDGIVEVRLNGNLVSTGLAPAPVSPLGYLTQWYPFSYGFTPTDAVNTLTFTALRPVGFAGSAVYAGLDDVSVTAVPEPSAYLLALAGLGLMGAAVKRRRMR